MIAGLTAAAAGVTVAATPALTDPWLAAATMAPGAPGSPATGARNVAEGLDVIPRAAWGDDLPPTGPLRSEDVRFLLVHHTASTFLLDDPRRVIRSVYAFHTGPQKRWPDVAYNFFVAPDGSVWEGRAGSLDEAVEADATGGNQGFAQLVCLIGDHSLTPPSTVAQDALVRTLAWLADRHRLGVHRGATARFVSRGSNRYPAGTPVATPVISPHRAVTFTACPGDAAVALLPTWRRRVFDILASTWVTDGLQRAERLGLDRP